MILYSQWLRLPLNKRAELANRLGVAKVRSTHVFNDTIADDGYEIHTLEAALTVDNLQAVLDTKEKDVEKLWAMLVDEPEPMATITPEEQTQFNQEYEDRTGEQAPQPEEIIEKPKKVRKTNAKTKTGDEK